MSEKICLNAVMCPATVQLNSLNPTRTKTGKSIKVSVNGLFYTQRRSVYAFCPFIHFGAGFEKRVPARHDRINVS